MASCPVAFAGIGFVDCKQGNCHTFCGQCPKSRHLNPTREVLGPRAAWETVFMDVAAAVARRSKDETTRVGAVVVNADNVIIGTGFNGFPKGAPDEMLPAGGPHRHLWVIHAEVNAVLSALGSRPGDVPSSTIYCTHRPCAACVKLMSHVGVLQVVFGVDELSSEQDQQATEVERVLGLRVRRRTE